MRQNRKRSKKIEQEKKQRDKMRKEEKKVVTIAILEKLEVNIIIK